SSGPHVHYEVRVNDEPQDPEKFIGLARVMPAAEREVRGVSGARRVPCRRGENREIFTSTPEKNPFLIPGLCLAANCSPDLIRDQRLILAGVELTLVRNPTGVNRVREQPVDVSARERLAAALDAICCGAALCFEPEADLALELGEGQQHVEREAPH